MAAKIDYRKIGKAKLDDEQIRAIVRGMMEVHRVIREASRGPAPEAVAAR